MVTTIHWRDMDWEIEESALAERWWSWTEYGDGKWVDLPRGPEWIDRVIATHHVVTLGYQDFPDGRSRLLWATQDGRIHCGSPMSVFPVLEQTDEHMAAAAALRERVIRAHAKEPVLL